MPSLIINQIISVTPSDKCVVVSVSTLQNVQLTSVSLNVERIVLNGYYIYICVCCTSFLSCDTCDSMLLSDRWFTLFEIEGSHRLARLISPVFPLDDWGRSVVMLPMICLMKVKHNVTSRLNKHATVWETVCGRFFSLHCSCHNQSQ